MRLTQLPRSGASRAINGFSPGKELSRLITAAVVNREFCDLLLADPAMAMTVGYNGEAFDVAAEEQELILSIRATSLADFASQLTKNGNGTGYTHSHNGNGHATMATTVNDK